MSIKFGQLHGRELRLTGEGNDEAHGYGGGRIVEPPPGAVEHFRQVMAAKGVNMPPPAPQRPQGGIKRNAQGIDTDLAAKAAEALARREKAAEPPGREEPVKRRPGQRGPLPSLCRTEFLFLHRAYCLGAGRDALAESKGLTGATLRRGFLKYELPVRQVGNTWRPEDAEAVARIHGLEIAQLGKIAGVGDGGGAAGDGERPDGGGAAG